VTVYENRKLSIGRERKRDRWRGVIWQRKHTLGGEDGIFMASERERMERIKYGRRLCIPASSV